MNPILEKRVGQITDLKHRDYLFVDFSDFKLENHALNKLGERIERLKNLARRNSLPQIQIKYPHKWVGFNREIKKIGFTEGLYFVAKKVTGYHSLPEGEIVEINDIFTIKEHLIIQQRLHYNLNPQFFCSLKDFDIQEYLEEIQSLMANRKAITYCVTEKGEKMGFIVIQKHNSAFYICELFVGKQYRGYGIGKKLMNAAFHYVSTQNKKTLYTSLAAQNQRALAFYKKCDFKETHVLSYYEL